MTNSEHQARHRDRKKQELAELKIQLEETQKVLHMMFEVWFFSRPMSRPILERAIRETATEEGCLQELIENAS